MSYESSSGVNALISRNFWYFGEQRPELPTDLVHPVHSRQGHALNVNRRLGDLDLLRAWLAAWPVGIHGAPIDAKSPIHRKT